MGGGGDGGNTVPCPHPGACNSYRCIDIIVIQTLETTRRRHIQKPTKNTKNNIVCVCNVDSQWKKLVLSRWWSSRIRSHLQNKYICWSYFCCNFLIYSNWLFGNRSKEAICGDYALYICPSRIVTICSRIYVCRQFSKPTNNSNNIIDI